MSDSGLEFSSFVLTTFGLNIRVYLLRVRDSGDFLPFQFSAVPHSTWGLSGLPRSRVGVPETHRVWYFLWGLSFTTFSVSDSRGITSDHLYFWRKSAVSSRFPDYMHGRLQSVP